MEIHLSEELVPGSAGSIYMVPEQSAAGNTDCEIIHSRLVVTKTESPSNFNEKPDHAMEKASNGHKKTSYFC